MTQRARVRHAEGVFIGGAAFSLREGISELIHPSATSSFIAAYVVLGVSTIGGIEDGLKHESPYIHRVDVVPVGDG